MGALIRRAELGGAFAAVTRKGDARAGAVIVKTYDTRNRSCRLYSEAFGRDGERLWIEPVRSEQESEIDAFLQRQATYDPDLWVIEIEDSQGRHFLTEPVAGERS